MPHTSHTLAHHVDLTLARTTDPPPFQHLFPLWSALLIIARSLSPSSFPFLTEFLQTSIQNCPTIYTTLQTSINRRVPFSLLHISLTYFSIVTPTKTIFLGQLPCTLVFMLTSAYNTQATKNLLQIHSLQLSNLTGNYTLPLTTRSPPKLKKNISFNFYHTLEPSGLKYVPLKISHPNPQWFILLCFHWPLNLLNSAFSKFLPMAFLSPQPHLKLTLYKLKTVLMTGLPLLSIYNRQSHLLTAPTKTKSHPPQSHFLIYCHSSFHLIQLLHILWPLLHLLQALHNSSHTQNLSSLKSSTDYRFVYLSSLSYQNFSSSLILFNQFGFLSFWWTTDALIPSCHTIQSSDSWLLFRHLWNFTKAFNSISHSSLLHTLNKLHQPTLQTCTLSLTQTLMNIPN